jgi:hypothetical protein
MGVPQALRVGGQTGTRRVEAAGMGWDGMGRAIDGPGHWTGCAVPLDPCAQLPRSCLMALVDWCGARAGRRLSPLAFLTGICTPGSA